MMMRLFYFIFCAILVVPFSGAFAQACGFTPYGDYVCGGVGAVGAQGPGQAGQAQPVNPNPTYALPPRPAPVLPNTDAYGHTAPWRQNSALGVLEIPENPLTSEEARRRNQEFRARLAQRLLTADPPYGGAYNLSPGECIQPPPLENPQICNISPSGGTCNFGTRDGIVRMPNVPVTGSVTIDGGRNVHLIGGEIRQAPGHHFGVGINNGPRNLHIEGLLIDAQRNCDAIAVRGRDRKRGPNAGINTRLTIQNVRTQGMDYNNPRSGKPNCHGDCLQFQFPGEITGLNLEVSVNNMTCHTGGQGFFTPLRSNQPGTQNIRANYNNLNFTRITEWQSMNGQDSEVLLWLQNDGAGPLINRSYPASLQNVWVDGGPRSFQPTNETVGTANFGRPPTGDFAPESEVGFNYNRDAFCTN